MTKYIYQKDGYKPNKGEIFVFGSNLAGVHGAGAAKEAVISYGAVMGIGIGPKGQSYALPTKDKKIETLPLNVIAVYVEQFIRYATLHIQDEFYVSRLGCVLAGYQNSDIAPLFKGAPRNCSFCIDWAPFLEDE